MQVETTKLKGCLVQVRVRESAPEMLKFRTKALDRIRQQAKIPGFRAGATIPEDVLLSHYGEDAIKEATLEEALDALYRKALKKSGVLPVEQGSIKKVESVSPLDVIIELETYPEVKIDLKKADKIKLPLEIPAVKEADIQKEVDGLRDRFVAWNLKDGVATKGDRVTLDAQGYEAKGGKEIPETKVAAYPLVLGSNSFIPGFEEKLEGVSTNGETSFDITFPADYHSKAFQKRAVHFVVKVSKVESKVLPELDDALAQKLRGPTATAEMVRKDIAQHLQETLTTQARGAFEEKLLDELLTITQVEPGDRLISHETDRVFADHKARLEEEGLDFKSYLEHLKTDEAKFKEEKVKPMALRRLKAELVLHELKEHRKPEVSDTEVKSEIDRLLSRYTDATFRAKAENEIYKPGTAYWEEVKTKMAYKKLIDTFVK